MKFVITLVVGMAIGFGLSLHFAENASTKDIAEAQKTTQKVEATVSSAASKAAKKSEKVYEVLKSDDDEKSVGHQGTK